MLNSGMGIFFAPNANIMPINFAICMKCDLITEHKTFIELVFFKILLHINTELFALSLVSCSYGLNDLQFVGFFYQTFPCYPPNCHCRYQGLHTSSSYRLFGASQESWRICLTFLSALAGGPDPFAVHRQSLSLNFFFQLQICFAVRDFLENFLTNTLCTILFEFVRAYSNTQNAFTLLANTI